MQEHDGFGLPESSAILRHLCRTRPGIPSHWYNSSDPRTAALVDAVMAWHGSTLRIGSMIVVFNLFIAANVGAKGNQPLVDDYGMPTLRNALSTLDEVWLKDTAYVAGEDISIADILLACEIEQLALLNGVQGAPTMEELLAPHAKVIAWLHRVRSSCQPHYDAAHSMIRKVCEHQSKKRQSRL